MKNSFLCLCVASLLGITVGCQKQNTPPTKQVENDQMENSQDVAPSCQEECGDCSFTTFPVPDSSAEKKEEKSEPLAELKNETEMPVLKSQ